MKRLAALGLALLLLLQAVPVYAETNAQNNPENGVLLWEETAITDENRYTPEFYQQPEEIVPDVGGDVDALGTAVTFEEYIINALENYQTDIEVSIYDIPVTEAGARFFQITSNNPQLFFVNSHIKYSYRGDYVIAYKVTYNDTEENIDQQRAFLDEAAAQILSKTDVSMSPVEQALTVHDELVLNCEYDYARLQAGTVPDISHTAYGALVNKTAVCDGYAQAYNYMLKKLGIDCSLVTSQRMNHAWSLIQLDGAWYHVDATWDDPVWDNLGRVVHKYFLVSDAKISENNDHYGYSAANAADSSAYDNSFWQEIKSAICSLNGDFYYAQRSDSDTVLMKKDLLLQGDAVPVYTEEVNWNYYSGCYMYLDKEEDTLYFNTATGIYELESDTAKLIYQPVRSGQNVIFGFTVRDGSVYYALQDSPNLNAQQVFQEIGLAELGLPELTGVSAQDIDTVYDNTPKEITLSGIQEDDQITFSLEKNGSYLAKQPVMKDAGSYTVYYKVKRSGFRILKGSAAVTIQKASPEYEIPVGLKGISGKTLADVSLPEGFAWKNGSIMLKETGEKQFSAVYTPADTGNYNIVTDILITIEVSCPEHQYISKVIQEATETREGLEQFTCIICGHSYEEKTAKVTSDTEIKGVTVSDIQTVYNGMARKVVVSGIQGTDQVTYASEENGAYSVNQPEMINAGVYTVYYQVRRPGYQTLKGSVNITIRKASPAYQIPTGLKGSSGKALSTVALPGGFTWQNGKTVLKNTGSQQFYAVYTPKDTVNYNTVVNIPVTWQVSCPGHHYTKKVIQKATETQEGKTQYTCTLCANSYVEKTKALTPKKPARVSGAKMSKSNTSSLKFTWKKAGGVKYRLMLYKGSKRISTKYVSGSSYTYRKLSAGTVYSLKITPYREVNRKKIYAASSVTVKTATAPKKAVLSSVKKVSSGKAKVSWKKTAGASGYEIYMRTGSGKYVKVKTITKGSSTSYTRTGLKKGKTYSFKIRAYKTAGGRKIYGSYSNVKSLKLK